MRYILLAVVAILLACVLCTKVQPKPCDPEADAAVADTLYEIADRLELGGNVADNVGRIRMEANFLRTRND
jgi:hypothetical protein